MPSDELSQMGFGETLFDLKATQFTHGEAVEIAGVPSKTLNNWTHRAVIDIGAMHRTGRRLYSILDLIELKIVGELAEMTQMPPTQAAAVAKWARTRTLELSTRDSEGKLPEVKPEERRFLMITFADGMHKIAVMTGSDWFLKFTLSHPMVVVPLDDVIWEVVNKAFDVLEREYTGKASAPKTDEHAGPEKTATGSRRRRSVKKR